MSEITEERIRDIIREEIALAAVAADEKIKDAAESIINISVKLAAHSASDFAKRLG